MNMVIVLANILCDKFLIREEIVFVLNLGGSFVFGKLFLYFTDSFNTWVALPVNHSN